MCYGSRPHLEISSRLTIAPCLEETLKCWFGCLVHHRPSAEEISCRELDRTLYYLPIHTHISITMFSKPLLLCVAILLAIFSVQVVGRRMPLSTRTTRPAKLPRSNAEAIKLGLPLIRPRSVPQSRSHLRSGGEADIYQVSMGVGTLPTWLSGRQIRLLNGRIHKEELRQLLLFRMSFSFRSAVKARSRKLTVAQADWIFERLRN